MTEDDKVKTAGAEAAGSQESSHTDGKGDPPVTVKGGPPPVATKPGIGLDRWIELAFTFGLLITSFIYAGIAICTLRTLSDQTQATKQAAEAATASAEAAKAANELASRNVKLAYRARIVFTSLPGLISGITFTPGGVTYGPIAYRNDGRGAATYVVPVIACVAVDNAAANDPASLLSEDEDVTSMKYLYDFGPLTAGQPGEQKGISQPLSDADAIEIKEGSLSRSRSCSSIGMNLTNGT